MRLIQLFEARKLTAWDLMAHYDVVDEAQATHDLMLPWVNNNRPGNITKMARDPKFRLAGQIRYYFKFILGVRNMMKPATTVEQFEAALNKPIPLWRGGGGNYDADFKSPRTWVSFTADERRVKTFSHYDGTHGGSSPGRMLQVRRDNWEIKLDLPLKNILLYLDGGGDSEIIVSKKDAKSAQLIESIMLTELQDIGDPSRMTSQELVDQLYENGWEEIGEESAYSDVYGKSGSPWVVKVLRDAQHAHDNDFMCAMQWYRYCLNNWQSNPHLPRIPFVKTLRESSVRGEQGYHTYVVMVERLDDFDGFEFEWQRDDPIENAVMWSVMGEFVGFHGNWASEEQTTEAVITILRMMPEHLVRRYYDGEPRYHEYISRSEFGSDVWYETLAEAIMGSGSPMTLRLLAFDGTMLTAAKGHILTQTLKVVNDMSRKSGCELDLHSGNVMVRPSTGELVITDPVQG